MDQDISRNSSAEGWEPVFNYRIFLAAMSKLATGAWESSRAQEWVTAVYRLLEQKTSYVLELAETSGYFQASPEEMELGLSGLLDYQQALEMLQHFCGAGDALYLEEAEELAESADSKLRAALELNRQVAPTLAFEAIG